MAAAQLVVAAPCWALETKGNEMGPRRLRFRKHVIDGSESFALCREQGA